MDECTQKVFSESFCDEIPEKEKVPVGTIQIDGVYYTIYNTDNLIGRDFKCDIVIQNNTVSSRHAIIEAEDPQTHLLYDVGSTNKTRIGKVVLKPNVRYSINDGDLITFGTVTSIYNISKQMPKTPEKTQPISIPETPCKNEEEVHIDFVPESPEEKEKDNVPQFDKSDVDLFDEQIEESVKPQIPDDIYELDTLSFDMKDFVKQMNDKGKMIKEGTEVKLQPVSEQADVSIYDLPTQGYSEEMEIPVKKCSLSDSENNSSLSETHISKVDKKPCEEIENKTVIAQKSVQGVPEVSENNQVTEMKNMPDEIEAAIEDFRNSQNSDMFGPSNSNLTPKKDDFDQFSDSGDESMCDLRTQQFRRPQLGIFSSAIEDDFLEPASQPVDESTFRPSLDNDSEVGKIDETLSSSVQSFFAGDEEMLVDKNADKSGDSSTYFAEKTLQDSAEIQSKESFERISSNIDRENYVTKISPDNLLESSNKTDPILISPNVKTAYSKTSDDFTVSEKQNISIDEDLYNAETQVPCYSEIQPKTPIVMSKVQIINNATYTQGFYEAETQALPSENRQRALEESDLKVGLVDNSGEGTDAGLAEPQNVLERNSKNEEEIEQVPSSSEKITEIAMNDSTENITESLQTNGNSVANAEKAASIENLSEIDTISKDVNIGCDVTGGGVIITGENCHIVKSPSEISSHLGDADCLEIAGKTQSCSDGKIDQTDSEKMSVNELTDLNDVKTLNVSEKNEIDVCVSEKLHLDDSRKAAEINSHLDDAGCLEFANKTQSCSDGKMDETDSGKMSVNELTDQNDVATLNVCVSEKLLLNVSRSAKRVEMKSLDNSSIQPALSSESTNIDANAWVQSMSASNLDNSLYPNVAATEEPASTTESNVIEVLNSGNNQITESTGNDALNKVLPEKLRTEPVPSIEQKNVAIPTQPSFENKNPQITVEQDAFNDTLVQNKGSTLPEFTESSKILDLIAKSNGTSLRKSYQSEGGSQPASLDSSQTVEPANSADKIHSLDCSSHQSEVPTEPAPGKFHISEAAVMENCDKIPLDDSSALYEADTQPAPVNPQISEQINSAGKCDLPSLEDSSCQFEAATQPAPRKFHTSEAVVLENCDQIPLDDSSALYEADTQPAPVNPQISEQINSAGKCDLPSLEDSSCQFEAATQPAPRKFHTSEAVVLENCDQIPLDDSSALYEADTQPAPVNPQISEQINSAGKCGLPSLEDSSCQFEAATQPAPRKFHTSEAVVLENCDQIPLDDSSALYEADTQPAPVNPQISEQINSAGKCDLPSLEDSSCQFEAATQPAPVKPHISESFISINSAGKCDQPPLDDSSLLYEAQTQPIAESLKIGTNVQGQLSSGNEIIVLPIKQEPLDDSSYLYEAATQPVTIDSLKFGNILPGQSCRNIPQDNGDISLNSGGKCDTPSLNASEAATQPAPVNFHISEMVDQINCTRKFNSTPLDDSSYLYEAPTQPAPELPELGIRLPDQATSGNELCVISIKEEPLNDSSFLHEAPTQPVPTYLLENDTIISVPIIRENDRIPSESTGNNCLLNDSFGQCEDETQPFPAAEQKSSETGLLCASNSVNNFEESSCLFETPTQPAQATCPEITLPSVSNKNITALPTTKDSLGVSIPSQPPSQEAANLGSNIISLTNSQKELNSEIDCSDRGLCHFKTPDPSNKTVTDIIHSIPCEKTKNLDKELPTKASNSCENSDSTFLNLNEIDKTGLHSPNAESTRIDDSLLSKTIATESKLPLANAENEILSSAVKTIGSVKKFKKSFPQPSKTIHTDDFAEKSGFIVVNDVPIKNQNEFEKIQNKEPSEISSDKDIPDVSVHILSPSQESRKTEFSEKSPISSVDMETSERKIENTGNDSDADVNSRVGNDVSTGHTRDDSVLKASKDISDSLTEDTRTNVIVEVSAKMSEDLANTERAEAINVPKSVPRRGRPRKATLAVRADLDDVAQVHNKDINVSSDSKKPAERLRRSDRKNSKDSDIPESKSTGSSISNENSTPKKERKGKNVSKNKEMKENLIVSENAGPSGVSMRTEDAKVGAPELKRNYRKKKAPEQKSSSVQPQIEAGDGCESTERPKRRKKPSDLKKLGVKTVNDEAMDSDASKNDYLSTGIGIGRGRSNNRPIIQSQSFPECTSTDNEEAMDSDASKNDYFSTGIGLGRGRSNNRPVIQSQSFPDCTSTDNEEAMDSDGPKNTYLATGLGLGRGRSRNRPVIQSQSLSESAMTGNDDSMPGKAPKNDYLATGIGLGRGRSKNRPIIQSDAENSQKLPKTSRRITNKKQNKLSEDNIGKNETSPSRSKRPSTDTLSDSQNSQHFDDSENENLGRGKRKRVKTSFDGFYTDEELKVNKPKSESPEILSGKVSTRKKSKENDITCQLSEKMDSSASKKILTCDSKPSTSKAHIFIDEDTIDDDLILPVPISKKVPPKLIKSSPNSEEKKKIIQDSFSKTQSFSFCDKLDEIFDIWGPADTVKLSPRVASTKSDSKKSTIMNPPSSKKSLKDKFDSGDKILNDSPKISKKTSRKLPEESSASCSKDSELPIPPKHKLNKKSEDVSAAKRARTRKALNNESDNLLEGGSSKSAGLIVSSADSLESTRGRRKAKQKSTLETNNASSEKIKTVRNNKNSSLKDVKTPENGPSSSNGDLTSFESHSDGFDDYIMSQEFSFREQSPKKSATNDEFKQPPLVPVRRSGRSRNSAKKSDGERTERVLFTGLNDRQLSDVVNNLGGRVDESPFTCTVLVTDKVRRTSKFLSVLSRGVPIVTPDWLTDSSSAAKFSDFDSYIVSDNDAEEQFGFNLKESLRQARSKKLLDGWSVFVTPSVKPSSGEMKIIIDCSGGKYLLKAPPTRWPPNSLVISCPADERDWAGLARRGKTPPIVSTEALFSGILRQNLNLEGYRLQ